MAKHSQLAQEHRKLLEQWGDAAVGDQVEELLAVRQQLADLIPRYDAACDMVAELRWVQEGSATARRLHMLVGSWGLMPARHVSRAYHHGSVKDPSARALPERAAAHL